MEEKNKQNKLNKTNKQTNLQIYHILIIDITTSLSAHAHYKSQKIYFHNHTVIWIKV